MTNTDNGFINLKSVGGVNVAPAKHPDVPIVLTDNLPSVSSALMGYSPVDIDFDKIIALRNAESYTDSAGGLEIITGTNIRALGGVELLPAQSALHVFAENDKLISTNAVLRAYNPTYGEIDNLITYLPSQEYADQMELAVGNNQRAWNGVAVSPAFDMLATDYTSTAIAPFMGAGTWGMEIGNNTWRRAGIVVTEGVGNTGAIFTALYNADGNPVNNDTPLAITNANGQSTDNYTTTGDGATVTATSVPKQNFSFTVNPDDPASIGLTWDVRLQASLNGTVWTDIGQHTNLDGAGVLVIVEKKPCTYYRTSCVGLVLGATATFIDVPVLAL